MFCNGLTGYTLAVLNNRILLPPAFRQSYITSSWFSGWRFLEEARKTAIFFLGGGGLYFIYIYIYIWTKKPGVRRSDMDGTDPRCSPMLATFSTEQEHMAKTFLAARSAAGRIP